MRMTWAYSQFKLGVALDGCEEKVRCLCVLNILKRSKNLPGKNVKNLPTKRSTICLAKRKKIGTS